MYKTLNGTIDLILERYKQDIQSIRKNVTGEPILAIISTTDDEPSQRYIRNKIKKCKEYGIKANVKYPSSLESLKQMIKEANNDFNITSIIIQYPMADYVEDYQKIFDMIAPEKDVDRLHSCFYYDKNKTNLPLTSEGIYDLLKHICLVIGEKQRILFIGNGVTTNKRLFLKCFDEGFADCAIINSKNSSLYAELLIEQADIIVAATGKNKTLYLKNKIFISPTICKLPNETFSNELLNPEDNITHNIIGKIGVLTTHNLIRRIYNDFASEMEKIV